jgi:hypothetical protein
VVYDEYRFDDVCEFMKKPIKVYETDTCDNGKYRLYLNSRDKVLFTNKCPLGRNVLILLSCNL